MLLNTFNLGKNFPPKTKNDQSMFFILQKYHKKIELFVMALGENGLIAPFQVTVKFY